MLQALQKKTYDLILMVSNPEHTHRLSLGRSARSVPVWNPAPANVGGVKYPNTEAVTTHTAGSCLASMAFTF